ncbi:hypothetical protein GCM10019016_113850 [Streptomyces prasinosporus]|uniref:Uncharacterized protein n=1 Tax=Streptomyces prasinosporus TaxID=68256 RepID=A0ABP6U9I5_9ACTN|nr:hypothetical protein GCM10010332_25830 [Streptomyces albogriseolus]
MRQDGDEQQRRPERDGQSQSGVDDGDVLDRVRQESGHRTWRSNRWDPIGRDRGVSEGLMEHGGPLREVPVVSGDDSSVARSRLTRQEIRESFFVNGPASSRRGAGARPSLRDGTAGVARRPPSPHNEAVTRDVSVGLTREATPCSTARSQS